jgi:hypothetical protein
MSESASNTGLQIVNNASASFVYFDSCSACGTLNGTIQLELTASTLVMTGPNATRTEIVTVAHIRCSPTAAADLQVMIGRALELLAKPPVTEGPAN